LSGMMTHARAYRETSNRHDVTAGEATVNGCSVQS
jgi:hypothetical protein